VDWGGETTEPKPLIMKSKRRRHDPEFKARVAIEALKNIKTASEIAKEFEIHPAQVSDWKKQMLDGVSELFGAGKKKSTEEELEAQKDKLHAKIGQQAVEIDFLKKKSKQLGL
jgi:transposase-like protein